jgi:DNA-binding beta-propeller fold protein YncE
MRYRFTHLVVPSTLVAISAAVVGWLAPSRSDAVTPPLTGETPILVPGGAGGYDWMAVDTTERRLLATHKGKGTLVVLDLTSGTKVTSIPVGAAQGIAVDAADGKYFVGDEDEHKVVVLDQKTLEKKNEIPVTGPVDAVALDPKRHLIFADCDNGTEVWVIDARSEKIVGTVKVSGAPEWIEYDPATDRLYQNVKTDATVQVIAPDEKKVKEVWKTAPATGPHGLAVDTAAGRVYTAGNNGKLAVLDIKTGKLLASADIGTGVDQIAFDPEKKRIYCACRSVLSVVEATPDGAKLLANVPQPKGAHTLAVDPATHAIWVSYADATESFLMKFAPGPM